MTETTEPTREQIEGRIAYLEALVSGHGHTVRWNTDLAVYRMALRTLDAEAQLAAMTRRAEEAEAKLESSRQVEACSKAFHDLVVKERDFERVRAARLEEERDVAMSRLAAMTARAENARVTAERDARPEISREDAAGFISVTMGARLPSTTDLVGAQNVRNALRAHAAGSGKGGS